MRRLLVVLGTALLGLTGLVAPALAAAPSPPSQSAVLTALHSDPVYVGPGAVSVDAGRIRDAVRQAPTPTFVVVLATGGPSAATVLRDLGPKLPSGNSTMAVLVGDNDYAAGSDVLPSGQARQLLAQAQSAGGSPTDVLVRWANNVSSQLASAPTASGGSGSSSGSGFPVGVAVVMGLVVIALVAAGGYLVTRRRRANRELEGRRAEVTSVYERLGSDVSLLDAKDDNVARQALADAGERYNSCGAALANANTDGEYESARRTALEGLAAARVARQRLGLDAGPEIKMPPSGGEQMHQPERVRVGDQEYQGQPSYAPGSPYYYGGGMLGGAFVPGGWYATPFWETMLLGSMLGGGFGWGGGGYGTGYDQGYDAGQDQGGGGDWGGGGGDWGGGGGDWGGGGGGSGGW